METLRIKGVRLITINDGVDSINGDDDFTPFRNIMDEYYARGTSKKIKSFLLALKVALRFCGQAPLRSAPQLSAEGGQFNARSGESFHRHVSLKIDKASCFCFLKQLK